MQKKIKYKINHIFKINRYAEIEHRKLIISYNQSDYLMVNQLNPKLSIIFYQLTAKQNKFIIKL